MCAASAAAGQACRGLCPACGGPRTHRDTMFNLKYRAVLVAVRMIACTLILGFSALTGGGAGRGDERSAGVVRQSNGRHNERFMIPSSTDREPGLHGNDQL